MAQMYVYGFYHQKPSPKQSPKQKAYSVIYLALPPPSRGTITITYMSQVPAVVSPCLSGCLPSPSPPLARAIRAIPRPELQESEPLTAGLSFALCS